MIRRTVCILLLFVFVACGASAREKTLRTTYLATTAAQAGFVKWDQEHQLEIARTAPSKLLGLAALTAYSTSTARADVVKAFELVYRTLAAAAILEDDPKSLVSAIAAAEQLGKVLKILTGGKLP